MAHNLTIRENGSAEFFCSVTAAWHNKGVVTDSKQNTTDGMRVSQLDWTVKKSPIFTKSKDGEWIQIQDRVAIQREDNDRVLSTMSPSYETIQNVQMAEFGDALAGAGNSHWETMGSIDGGRIVFMQMELEGSMFLKSNPDDKTVKKLLLLNSHDGSHALMGMLTPIRVVCQNTLNAALGNHSNQFKIYHRKNYASKKEYAAKVLGLAYAYYDDLQLVMDQLAEEQVTKTYVEGFVNALIPSAKEEVSTRTENRRSQITDLFSTGKGNNGETKWDLFNAVTEYVDHHSVGRLTNSRMERSEALADIEQEARFERSILGSGATLKQKALNLLLN